MKAINKYFVSLIILLSVSGCTLSNLTPESKLFDSTQKQFDKIYIVDNQDSLITLESILDTFKSSGFDIVSNRDMNSYFKMYYGKKRFDSYHSVMIENKEISLKLLKKNPLFGLYIPLKIVIWQEHSKVYIASVALHTISRISNISSADSDLILYMDKLDATIKQALPHATRINKVNTNLTLEISKINNIVYPITILENEAPLDYIAEYEADFEGYLQKFGLKVPYYRDVLKSYDSEELNNKYDFFHIYSIEKLNVIYKISKIYPQCATNLPVSISIYKKKGYNKLHINYISPDYLIKYLEIDNMKLKNSLLKFSKMLDENIEYQKEAF